ncbi:MAG: hypothetical protein STSR0008_21920 [Ignavibacterium sp.]
MELETNKIYNKDCIEGMKNIPSNSIDIVITDPPFAIDFKAVRNNYNRMDSRVIEGYNEIEKEESFMINYYFFKSIVFFINSGRIYLFVYDESST